jgi:hypothetical protein
MRGFSGAQSDWLGLKRQQEILSVEAGHAITDKLSAFRR